MKYLILLFLLLTACGPALPTPKIDNNDHEAWLKKKSKGPEYKLPGKFKVVERSNPYYKCKGTIEGGAYLNDQLKWFYFFSTLKCGNTKTSTGGALFYANQIKRTGNLAD